MSLFSRLGRAELLLISSTFIASLGWIFSKESIAYLPIFGFIGLRFLVASICLLPFCYGDFTKTRKKNLVKGFSTGGVLGSAILLWIYAVSISENLGEGAFIMSLSMLFVPLVAWVLASEKPKISFWYSLPFAISGLILLSEASHWHQSGSQLWFLSAASMLAVHFYFNSHYAKRIPVLLLTCIQLFCIGLMGIVVSLCYEVWPVSVPHVIWVWFALSALIATSLRYVLQTQGQKGTTTSNAAMIMILEPVFTLFLSILWLAEDISFYKVIACTLILIAIVINKSGNKILEIYSRIKGVSTRKV